MVCVGLSLVRTDRQGSRKGLSPDVRARSDAIGSPVGDGKGPWDGKKRLGRTIFSWGPLYGPCSNEGPAPVLLTSVPHRPFFPFSRRPTPRARDDGRSAAHQSAQRDSFTEPKTCLVSSGRRTMKGEVTKEAPRKEAPMEAKGARAVVTDQPVSPA